MNVFYTIVGTTYKRKLKSLFRFKFFKIKIPMLHFFFCGNCLPYSCDRGVVSFFDYERILFHFTGLIMYSGFHVRFAAGAYVRATVNFFFVLFRAFLLRPLILVLLSGL